MPPAGTPESYDERVLEALLDCFSRTDLEILVRHKLDHKLDAEVEDGPFRGVVFDLIEWAKQKGLLLKLLTAAAEAVPGKPILARLRDECPPPPAGSAAPPEPNASRTGSPSVRSPRSTTRRGFLVGVGVGTAGVGLVGGGLWWAFKGTRQAGELYTLHIPGKFEMTFAWCPPGSFDRGGMNGHPDERPVRRVTLTKGFYAGVHEVTQSQWEAVMGAGGNPSHFRGENLPVDGVRWEAAQEFCEALRERTGRPIRLPTEAEWEYACRAGTDWDYCNGDGEDALRPVGWYRGNSDSKTHPVGRRNANRWGLCDVHGNVYELCADWYDETYYRSGPTTDPGGPEGSPKGRVMRGGSWLDYSADCRAACRIWYVPGFTSSLIGLRVVFTPD